MFSTNYVRFNKNTNTSHSPTPLSVIPSYERHQLRAGCGYSFIQQIFLQHQLCAWIIQAGESRKEGRGTFGSLV